jgi:DNA-directed RNA polymerase specialized sigma24 family protein
VRTEQSDSGSGAHGGLFATTHWSVVLAAAERNTAQSAAALEQLCRTYWYPLYAYVRRRGYSPEDAQDVTQGYFARLLARDSLAAALPEHGRFRCFMLATLKRYLINCQERAGAIKRGGSAVHVPFNGGDAEEQYRLDASEQDSPDKLFDRAWALSVMEAASRHLQEEYRFEGKDKLFDRLKFFLARNETKNTYAAAGAELGMSEGAVKMAVLRLRRRYRDLLREQVAQTVSSAVNLNDEMQSLRAAFSG